LRKGRLGQHYDTAVATLRRSFHFSNDDVDVAHIRNDRHWYITVAYLVPFRQRIVVSLHARQLESGIGLKKSEIGHRAIRVEHFAVDAIIVEGFQSLSRIVNNLRHFLPAPPIVTALDP